MADIDLASADSLSATRRPFAPDHGWDRNFFLLILLTIWVGILMGFGGDIAHHYAKSGLNYPLIVHVHAAAFVGWLVLLTTQILLIRNRNYDLHKKLGVAGACLAAAMLVLGPAAEIIVGKIDYGTPDSDPAFQAIAFTGVLLFGLMVGGALILRKNGSAHKRLMLLGTLAISNAGFSRWLGGNLAQLFGHSQPAFWGIFYLIPTVLVLSIGVYDLITRRRLVPAYVAGALLCFCLQIASVWLYFQPAWLTLSQHIVGH